MTDTPRLIEVAFPLKQTSLDSVHEKNVRHGHISTLHIWPARRPLAACRAALIATLLPDPGNKEERDEILQRLAGKVVEVVKKKKLPSGKIKEKLTEETEGGILHWGRESSPDLDWFREKICEAYGGKAPKVLDPFSGGGAIPLEAMRLGCEATAIDINPVAWFILKCTLEYPQKLAGQKLPLPDFVVENREFMESYFKQNDGELIDDASRFGNDKAKSKANYEDGMYRVFQNCHKALKPEGRLVIVFAHKHPDAWETLVSAIIRAGFIVDGSWPIQTEMGNRTRALSSAALSSSVWLVCKKRPITARPGWDNRVLEDMRDKLQGKWDEELKKWTSSPKLREFWDAGIRGPDFVWAATGPAMEAYSKHPVVKKANEPGQLLTVSDFLKQVRRMVLDFVVGRVLSETTRSEEVSSLDDISTYYLLHRHDFGMEDAPIGACILYAVSCGLSDKALADQFDILTRTGGKTKAEDDDEEDEEVAEDADAEIEQGTGSKVKLKTWQQRKRKNMGYEVAGDRPIPLIDQVHRLMHLWKAGDVVKVDEYLDDKGLRRNALFNQLLQALIELATAGSDERALLESISNHIAARGKESDAIQLGLFNTNNGDI